jgi:branched-chain amino acid transport system substrate-binding protein
MKRVVVGMAVLGVLSLVACSRQRVIVGVVLPETGIAKGYGPSIKAGIKLALDDAMAKNTPKGVEVWFRDSNSRPEYARKALDELFKSEAPIVIGGVTSEEAKAMIPGAETANHIIISPAATEPILAASSNLFFRVCPSDEVEGVVAADFMVTTKKAKTVLVLFQKGEYADGMLPVFSGEVTKLGAKVSGQLPIGPTDWDKAIAEALTAGKPDGVFICAWGAETLATLNVLRTAGFAGTICATSAISTSDVLRQGGQLAEGVFVPVLALDLDSPKEPIASFVKRFKAANKGAKPDLYAAYGYDAAMTALAALQDPQPKDTNELLQRLMKLADHQGVTGPMSFDSVGNTTHRPRIHCVKSGKLVDCNPT